MSQNGHIHFKNLATNAARFLKCAYHFGTLCIKGLIGIAYDHEITQHMHGVMLLCFWKKLLLLSS